MSDTKPTQTMRLLLIAVLQQAKNERQHDVYYTVRSLYRELYGKEATY